MKVAALYLLVWPMVVCQWWAMERLFEKSDLSLRRYVAAHLRWLWKLLW